MIDLNDHDTAALLNVARLFESAHQLEKSSIYYCAAGSAFLVSGRTLEAWEHLHQALALHPENHSARSLLRKTFG